MYGGSYPRFLNPRPSLEDEVKVALDSNGRAQLDEFFAGIACHASAFQHATFSYVALPDRDRWVVLVGSLVLHALAPTMPSRRFDSAKARAGMFHLDNAADALSFLVRITEGTIDTPHGPLDFPATAGTTPPRHGVNHVPFNPIGNQARLDTALLMGEQAATFIHQPVLDWSLKASSPPYNGLSDLLSDFALPPESAAIAVHLAAQCAVMIDVSSSANGNTATLAVGLASGLDPKLASAGVIIHHGRVLERRHIPSADFSWRQDALRQVGEARLEIPTGALLHCFANYDGIAHHHFWVADPAQSQNHRRVVLETINYGIQTISDMIVEARAEPGAARKFESAVAWLLWLLGFSPAHLGDTAKVQDAPDILVATPSGHIAVVECTTGLVTNEKLSKLRARALAIRQRLDASNLGWSRVLAVLVCARGEQDVEHERDRAARMGIVIVDGDDLLSQLNRTKFAPDADRVFAEAEQSLAQRNAVA